MTDTPFASDPDSIFTLPRIISCEVISWDDGRGESTRVKANGSYIHEGFVYPISVHVTVPLGHPAIPVLGDLIKVVISRSTSEDYANINVPPDA